jgi:ribosomal protein S8
MGEVAVSINEKRILAASDNGLLTTYSEGKSKVKLYEGVLSKAKGNVMSMYLSVEKLVNNIPAEEMKLPDSVLNDVKGLLKDFTVATEPSNGKSQRSTLELNFKNENQNTLVQIVNFSKKMFAYYSAHKKEQEAAWGNGDSMAVDSTAVVVDTVAAPATN